MLLGVAWVWLGAALVLAPSYREVAGELLLAFHLGASAVWTISLLKLLMGVSLLGGALAIFLDHRGLSRLASPPMLGLQALFIIGSTLALGWSDRWLLVHPMGVLTKNLPMLGCLWAAYWLSKEGWSARTIWLLRIAMAVVWMTEGLLPKILFQQELELSIARRSPFVPIAPSLFVTLLGAAQLMSGIGALVLRGRALKVLLVLQASALLVLPIIVTLDDISPWLHPLGPLFKNAPILAGTSILAYRGVSYGTVAETKGQGNARVKNRKWPLWARRILKGSHVALGGIWLGAATMLSLLQLPTPLSIAGPSLSGASDGLQGLTYTMMLIDDYVIIPSAVAIVLTGLLYGLRTQWGFIHFDWVIVKWVSTLAFIGFGALFLGPWIHVMHDLAREAGDRAFEDASYQAARMQVLGWGAAQTLALAGLIFVSIFKPWGKRTRSS